MVVLPKCRRTDCGAKIKKAIPKDGRQKASAKALLVYQCGRPLTRVVAVHRCHCRVMKMMLPRRYPPPSAPLK